jgi:hypothetical protein
MKDGRLKMKKLRWGYCTFTSRPQLVKRNIQFYDSELNLKHQEKERGLFWE